MVVPLDNINVSDITVQERRDRITAALEQAGIVQQIMDLSPELTKNAKGEVTAKPFEEGDDSDDEPEDEEDGESDDEAEMLF